MRRPAAVRRATIEWSSAARWPGIGHNSVYAFAARDCFVAHAYDANDGGRSKLKILPLTWDDAGWPVVDTSSLSN